MGMIINTIVGKQGLGEGLQAAGALRQQTDGSLVVAESHGKFYEQCLRGNVFTASTPAAGIVIPVVAGTGTTPTLWNPLGSGVVTEVIRMTVDWISGTPLPVGGFSFGYLNNTGANASTGASNPILTFANIAPVNMLLGSGKVASTKFAAATVTFTAAATFFMPVGFSTTAGTAAMVAAPFSWIIDYDGQLCIPPGNALVLASTISSVGLYCVSYTFIENPYPTILS
jgi:hypothetical protein